MAAATGSCAWYLPCQYLPAWSCPAGNNDIITLKADDSGEMLTLMYEDPKADRVSGEPSLPSDAHSPFLHVCVHSQLLCIHMHKCTQHGNALTPCSSPAASRQSSLLIQCTWNVDRVASFAMCAELSCAAIAASVWCCSIVLGLVSTPCPADFSLKLMEIDSEHLAIPETEYSATVRMPAGGHTATVQCRTHLTSHVAAAHSCISADHTRDHACTWPHTQVHTPQPHTQQPRLCGHTCSTCMPQVSTVGKQQNCGLLSDLTNQALCCAGVSRVQLTMHAL